MCASCELLLQKATDQVKEYAETQIELKLGEKARDWLGREEFEKIQAVYDQDVNGQLELAEWKSWAQTLGASGVLGVLLEILRRHLTKQTRREARKRGELWTAMDKRRTDDQASRR